MNKSPRTEPRKKWYMAGFFPGILYGTEVEFERLRHYLTIVVKHLENEAIYFRKEVEASVRSQGLTEEQAERYYDSHLDEFEMWHYSFPNTIRTTVLISACSLLEASLTDLCKYLEKEIEMISLKWGAIDRDKGIRRARAFLKKNFLIHLEDHPSWQSILDYYHVRDALVHADGDLSLLSEKNLCEVKQVLTRPSGIDIHVDCNRVRITNSFLNVVLKDIATFWKALGTAFIQNSIIGPKYWP